MKVLFAIALAVWPAVASAQAVDGMFASGAVAAVLDGWHAAAAAANEEKYFSYFSPDAVFLGTDGTERWTLAEFRKYSHPYFARGNAWTFRAVSRNIAFAPDRTVAWFDEMLDTANMGRCRGSGVLLSTPAGWKIVQYNLSIPIPNDLTDEVTKKIAASAKTGTSK
jgi:ketosteroid isomerase-like protein